MDPQQSHVSVKDDDAHAKPSSSDERSCVVPAEGSSDGKDGVLVEKVKEIALDSGNVKTEWKASTASIHLTTNVHNKVGIFEEEEEGELDYEEDEGEIAAAAAQEDKNGVKNDTEGDDKEEGELEEEDEQGEEGEEGEILSDEDTKGNEEKKSQEKQDSTNEGDGPEEGEVIEDGDSTGVQNLRRKVCRYFTYGGCTWGMSCRFLHPGLNDKGAYQMLPELGQYPSPFPKVPAVVPPVHPEAIMPSFPDQDIGQMDENVADRTHPSSETTAPPRKETAWERGLKLAKEIKKAAQKRKEEDADFEEKRMILGITAEGDEDENDKENMIRRREMMRNRLEKDSMFYEEEDRSRREGDIVSRWRDKRDSSPVQYRDRERRKKRAYRTPSSSPERDRRSRRRGGEKDKQKEKAKEINKEREKERTKKPAKELEKTGEEKVKKKRDKGKEIPDLGAGKNDSEVTQEKHTEETEKTTSEEIHKDTTEATEENKNREEERKKRIEEVSESAMTKTTKETEKKEDVREIGSDDKDKYKPKALGISSSRLPNDEWIDPWQRTTSPKRHSVSSRSSRSRSSSSSSDSSRSSRSRSHSGSESRSTSRSASRSRSRSVSPASSRSRSRSHSGSRSKSRSRSGSRSSGSDRSSSASSTNSPVREVKTVQDEDRGASHSSESESESNKSKSPTLVQKSPSKLKGQSPDNAGPRTPPVESDRNIKENRNRYEYGRADRIEKSHGSGGWGRKGVGVRPPEEPYSRQRGHHSRKGKSPDRRRRSRSPRGRNEDRRRADQSKTRERSSSADSMEHALARPSSPRTTRERGGGRRGSSASSSSSESQSSVTGSESEDEQHPAKTRRAVPRTEQLKQAQNVPLTSGNIRYTGHKDIKLTLNKSVARTDNMNPSKPPQHSPPSRSEANSSSDKQSTLKKRPRDPSPVSDAAMAGKEAVSSSVMPQPAKPEKRSADSPAEPVTSGKSNTTNTSSRREELLRELKAVEDAIARKRARIE